MKNQKNIEIFCSALFVVSSVFGCGPSGVNSETKVINGTVYDSNVDRDGVNLATVRLWFKRPGSNQSCTATRVSERVFLTASHCLENPTEILGLFIKGGFASTYDGIVDSFKMSDLSIHPKFAGPAQYDIGLIRISASDAVKLSKVKIARVSFDPPAYHESVDMYGYGCAARGGQSDGHKRYGTSILAQSSVLGAEYRYVNLTPAQDFDPIEPKLCQGDSGGPLVQKGKVIGVNTGFRSDYSFYARLDFNDVKTWYADFIDRD